MSVMIWLAPSFGSTAKYALPMIRSYGPVLPKDWPSSTSVRSETSRRRNAAESIGQRQRKSIPARLSMGILEHTRDPLLHERAGLGRKPVPAFEHMELHVRRVQPEPFGIPLRGLGLVELVLPPRDVQK